MDRGLLQALWAGDRRAIKQLWSELMTRLGDYFLSRVHDSDAAMDLAQHTISDLLEKGVVGTISSEEELLSRVYGFADKQLKRYREEQRRRRGREEKLAAHGVELELLDSPSLERSYADAEARSFFDDLLEQLPADLQAFWRLRAEGHSYAKIAQLTKASESTAQRRLDAAQRRLRRGYERKRRTPPQLRSPPRAAS